MGRIYRDKRWVEFREEVVGLDGDACVRCGRTSPEVVLQAHHKTYEKGKAPWEYAPSACDTLCKGCHAREHGIIRPSDGWSLCAEEDLGGLHGECECCGTAIRYVYVLEHQGWEPISVGTVCCDNLTGTTVATEHRRGLERRRRFICSKRWKPCPTGLSIKHRKWLEVRIERDNGAFRVYMNNVAGNKRFKTENSAKGFVFDVIETGDARKFAVNHPLRSVYV